MQRAAEEIGKYTKGAVLLKGGHLINDACDYLYQQGQGEWFRSQRIDTTNTHGTGCTLSSAIACGLADGKTLAQSVAQAKTYLVGALADGLDLGKGCGPMNHMYRIKD